MAATYSNKGFTIALGLFVLLLAVYAVLQSPLFQLRTIELVGAERLTPEDIARAGNLEVGVNLFAFSLRDLTAAIEQNPLVESVRLSRRVPGRLVVRIEERRPVAYLSSGAEIWAVDAVGHPLFTSERMSMAVPVITLDPPAVVAPGARLWDPHLANALGFIGALSVKARSNLSEVHSEPTGLVAYSRDGVTIRLGIGGDVAEQARVLDALLEKIDDGNLKVSRIDLSSPRAPVLQE